MAPISKKREAEAAAIRRTEAALLATQVAVDHLVRKTVVWFSNPAHRRHRLGLIVRRLSGMHICVWFDANSGLHEIRNGRSRYEGSTSVHYLDDLRKAHPAARPPALDALLQQVEGWLAK